MSYIALGAHGAFDDDIRTYVGLSAFVASALPAATKLIWGLQEPLIHTNVSLSQLSFYCILAIFAVTPYLATAFVTTERTAKFLFWASIICNTLAQLFTSRLYRFITKNHRKASNIAVNIELFVEKFEILSMMVLGESVLGILFEVALVITDKDIQLRHLYGATAIAAGMLDALQTLYNNVDAPIAKGSKHAIRYRRVNRVLWGLFHIPYHGALILFATGLGIAIHDIGLKPKDDSYETARLLLTEVVRAGEAKRLNFNHIRTRRMFSVGWSVSMVSSGLIGSVHHHGPRAATKKWRFLIRCLIVTPMAIGLPYADLAPDTFMYIFGAILVTIAIVEYVFVQMDKIGFSVRRPKCFLAR